MEIRFFDCFFWFLHGYCFFEKNVWFNYKYKRFNTLIVGNKLKHACKFVGIQTVFYLFFIYKFWNVSAGYKSLDCKEIKKNPPIWEVFFNWLRGMDLLCHLETFAVANRRPGVRLVSAVEPPSSVVQIQQHTKIKNTPLQGRFSFNWLRGMDLNHWPSGYEKTTFLNF